MVVFEDVNGPSVKTDNITDIVRAVPNIGTLTFISTCNNGSNLAIGQCTSKCGVKYFSIRLRLR